MKIINLLLLLSLGSLAGCGQLNKILGEDTEPEQGQTPTGGVFSGSDTFPGLSFSKTLDRSPSTVQAYVCNSTLQPAAGEPCAYGGFPYHAQYEVPVYTSLQPALITPYAYWNFSGGLFQVVFENVPDEITIPNPQTPDPFDTMLWPDDRVLFYIRAN